MHADDEAFGDKIAFDHFAGAVLQADLLRADVC